MDIYTAIFRNAPDPIILVDGEGFVVAANPNAHLALGYEDGELTGLSLEKLIPDRLTEAHQQHRAGFMANPHTRPMGSGKILSARRKDGSEIPVDIMLSIAEGKEGRFVIAILRDRTEQMRTEAQLRDLQEKLRLSAEAAGMGYWTHDEALDEFWCDANYAALLGGKPEDFRNGESVRQRVSAMDLELRGRRITESLGANGRYEAEFRIILPDGSLRWIGELGRSTGAQAAPHRKFAGVSFDISGRKADQARAEESQRRERELLDQAPDGIFLADLQAIISDANAAGCRLLGRERGEIVGRSIHDFLHPEEFDRLAVDKEKMLAGEIITAEWRVRDKDGCYFPVEVSARIFPDGRWQGFVRDIRDRKAAEAKRTDLIASLEASLKENRVLRGMLPICAHCKQIRDEAGKWHPVEVYIHNRSEAEFSHGICPTCLKLHFSEAMRP